MQDRISISIEKFSRLTYRKMGSGPVLVLLHGFPEDGTTWRNIWDKLAEQNTLIIPDLPGAGGSVYNGDELTIELMAESVLHILQHERIEKAIIAGHSMGGYTAMAFADMYGNRVQGLSMIHSTATADDDNKKGIRRKAIDIIRKGGKEAFLKQSTPGLFSQSFNDQHPEIIKAQIERGMSVEDRSMIAFYNAMIMRPDRTATLSNALFPVQWIIGREDNIAPLDKVLHQATLSDVTFVSLYEHVAHMSMIEYPAQLTNDVGTFCTYAANYKEN